MGLQQYKARAVIIYFHFFLPAEINFSKVFEFNADTPTLQCSKTYMGNWDAAPRQFKVVLRCNQSNGIEVSVNETLVMVESGCYTYLLVGVVTGVSIVILGLCIAVACVVLSVKVQKKRYIPNIFFLPGYHCDTIATVKMIF